ncbi:hypothetical protein [Streptomyces anulatus]|uniref:hypothetical protein n=1 Tax=Streptomyces anulatus TaxID=1892 RepID=UPI0036A61A73
MAENSWPSPTHNGRAVTDAEYEQVAARFSDDGVYGSPADAQVITAGSGLTVNVRANVTASVRGHIWTSGPSGAILQIATNGAGQTRTDRIVLRLDRSTWTVRVAVKQGTPGAGAPPLTRNTGTSGVWEILLATVTVQSNALSTTVARGELYVGTRVRPSLSTARNPYPEQGELAYDTDTDTLRIYSGSAWRSMYQRADPVVIDSPYPPGGWVNETASVIEMRGGVVSLRLGSFLRGGRTPADSQVNTRLPVIIPAALRHPNRDQFGLVYITGAYVGRVTIFSRTQAEAGQVWLTQNPTIPVGSRVLSSGMTWVVD